MRIMYVLFAVVAFAFPAMAADLNQPPPRDPPRSSGCAAIAISTTPEKPDGWGAESAKNTCEAAVSSARAYCERNMHKQRIYHGQCANVAKSRDWVAGIICHIPGVKVWYGLGDGRTPERAIQKALDHLGDAPAKYCGTALIRSAHHKWREFYPTPWRVKLSCSRTIIASSEELGFTALQRAILSAGNAPASSCRVEEASYR